ELLVRQARDDLAGVMGANHQAPPPVSRGPCWRNVVSEGIHRPLSPEVRYACAVNLSPGPGAPPPKAVAWGGVPVCRRAGFAPSCLAPPQAPPLRFGEGVWGEGETAAACPAAPPPPVS